MSQDGLFPVDRVLPHGPNGKCDCKPERLAAQLLAQQQSPSTVLRRARITNPTDPDYMDLETIAHVLHCWAKIKLHQPCDDLWRILWQRIHWVVAKVNRIPIARHKDEQIVIRKDILQDITVEMWKGIANGTYMWMCKFNYALDMRFKSAVGSYFTKNRPDIVTMLDIEDETECNSLPRDHRTSEYSSVDSWDYLRTDILSQLSNDQVAAFRLFSEGYSYEEIAHEMRISLKQCTALLKQGRDKADRVIAANLKRGHDDER